MNCECNNKSNRVKPGIKHVYGNVLRMAIPLTLRTLVKDGDEMVVTDTDFIPSSDHPVRVVFSKGKTNYPIIATMDGNVAIVEDKGKIPVGTYDISVECYDDLGNPYRFKQNAVLYVADTTAEAGIDEEIEYEAQTWYLNAAVFLATTEIGEIGDVIDAKLDDVFGNVLYDANAKEIRFYNKGNSRVLATIDSRPFVVDGTVADVYIDVSRQVLVVVLNEDAGGRRFSVPLYLVFNSYYKKYEVDNKLIGLMAKEDFVYEGSNKVKYSSVPEIVLSHIEGVSMMEETQSRLFGTSDGHIKGYVGATGSELFDYGLAPDGLVFLDKTSGLFYRWNRTAWQQVGGSGSSSGGYEPPVGGIPKTDLASDVQTSLGKADTALQSSDLDGYATTDDVDDAVAALVSSAPQTLDTLKELADALGDDPNFATTMATQLGNKVDKEFGKGLSSNDFTTALRNKLMGIEAGAQANVKADWNAESGDAQILNKPTIPTKVSDLTNDAGYTDNQGTVTGISVNGGSIQSPTNGVVNLTIGTGGPNDIVGVTTTQQGTIIFTKRNNDTVTVDLNHVHPQYLKYELLADEAAYTALATKDSSTLYLIPES